MTPSHGGVSSDEMSNSAYIPLQSTSPITLLLQLTRSATWHCDHDGSTTYILHTIVSYSLAVTYATEAAITKGYI